MRVIYLTPRCDQPPACLPVPPEFQPMLTPVVMSPYLHCPSSRQPPPPPPSLPLPASPNGKKSLISHRTINSRQRGFFENRVLILQSFSFTLLYPVFHISNRSPCTQLGLLSGKKRKKKKRHTASTSFGALKCQTSSLICRKKKTASVNFKSPIGVYHAAKGQGILQSQNQYAPGKSSRGAVGG